MSSVVTKDVYNERPDEYDRFIRDYCEDELSGLADYPQKSTFIVDWQDVFSWDPDVARDIEKSPQSFAEVFKHAVQHVNSVPVTDGLEKLSVRFTNVADPQSVPELRRGDDVGNLVTLRGQVEKTTPVEPRLTTAQIRCKVCGAMYDYSVPDHGGLDIDRCMAGDCNSKRIEPVFESSEYQYHQLARIKQPPEEDTTDTHIDVHLTKDLAGEVTSGERVDVSGVLHPFFEDNNQAIPDFYLSGHDVIHHESDYESIDVTDYKAEFEEFAGGEHGNPYKLLVDSIAPSIIGGEYIRTIKLAIGLALFGGWRRPYGDGRYARGDPHIALIGDPQTGKSSLLSAAQALSPRSAYTSGKNVSKAGITAAAVRDDFGESEWNLEAGAIVKAHKGIACVDEIDKVDPDALSSLHTALEKQRLEVSKAGINASLACETTLLAAGNPRDGRFIKEDAVIPQLSMEPALRSRFDCIFPLFDAPESERDKRLATHMSEIRRESALRATGEVEDNDGMGGEQAVSTPVLRAWIAFAREHVHPKVRDESLHGYIAEEYDRYRGSDDGEHGLGPRTVDAMHRFAEASARVRLSDTITKEDIDRATAILETSLKHLQVLDKDGEPTAMGDMLDSGTTQQEREAYSSIEGIIRTLQPSETETVAVDDVIETALESDGVDMTSHQIRQRINHLKQDGKATGDMKDGEVRML